MTYERSWTNEEAREIIAAGKRDGITEREHPARYYEIEAARELLAMRKRDADAGYDPHAA